MSQVRFRVENQQYVWISNFHKETLGEFILKVTNEDFLKGVRWSNENKTTQL